MPESVLQLDSRDNVLVALTPLEIGTVVHYGNATCTVTQAIPPKHKVALVDFKPGDLVRMYGMVVGEATEPIPRGGLLSTRNIRHRAGDYIGARGNPFPSTQPDASAWSERTFMGYHRADGQVGTRNYWLVLPLVFCENRNVERMREALEEELGYGSAHNSYRQHVRQLVERNASGDGNGMPHEFAHANPSESSPTSTAFAFSLTKAAAAARARMRRHSADCWPDISTIPTSPAQQCSALAARTRSPACCWTSCARAIPRCASPCSDLRSAAVGSRNRV